MRRIAWLPTLRRPRCLDIAITCAWSENAREVPPSAGRLGAWQVSAFHRVSEPQLCADDVPKLCIRQTTSITIVVSVPLMRRGDKATTLRRLVRQESAGLRLMDGSLKSPSL